MAKEFKVVVRRNERTVVLTGWRARLTFIATMLIAWVLMALVAIVLVGLTLSVGLAFLLVLPAAIIVFALQALLSGNKP